MQYLFLGLIIILSVLGLTELIRLICYKIWSIPESSFTMVVHLRSENEAEYIIEALLERIHWNSIDFDVLLLYDKENVGIKTVAEKLISKYINITLLTYEDLNYNHIIKRKGTIQDARKNTP